MTGTGTELISMVKSEDTGLYLRFGEAMGRGGLMPMAKGDLALNSSYE
jgi:hypothetical protein